MLAHFPNFSLKWGEALLSCEPHNILSELYVLTSSVLVAVEVFKDLVSVYYLFSFQNNWFVIL